MFTSPTLWCEPNGHIVAANGALVRLLGYPEDELVGRALTSILELEAHDRIVAAMEDLRDGKKREIRVAAVKKDGKSVDLGWELTPILVKGTSTGFFAVAQARS